MRGRVDFEIRENLGGTMQSTSIAIINKQMGLIFYMLILINSFLRSFIHLFISFIADDDALENVYHGTKKNSRSHVTMIQLLYNI